MAFNNQSYTIYRGNTNTSGTDYGVNQDGALDNYGIFFGGTFNYSAINTFITTGGLTGGTDPGNYTMTTSGGVKIFITNQHKHNVSNRRSKPNSTRWSSLYTRLWK
jgi:hypothetical protein